MTEPSPSVLHALRDIIIAPGAALEAARAHPSWLWAPLLISIALACGLWVHYYTWVDFDWLIDETLRQLPAAESALSSGALRNVMSPQTSMSTTVTAIAFMTFFIYLSEALYFHLANKVIRGPEIRFGQWFAFSAWISFVGVFTSLAGFATILTADSNQLAPESLQVLSLNNLLIQAEHGSPWYQWASSLSPVNFWMLIIAGIGFADWTGAGAARSAMIVVLPWALIYGVWAALI